MGDKFLSKQSGAGRIQCLVAHPRRLCCSFSFWNSKIFWALKNIYGELSFYRITPHKCKEGFSQFYLLFLTTCFQPEEYYSRLQFFVNSFFKKIFYFWEHRRKIHPR